VKRYGVVEELIRTEMEEEQSNIKLGSCISCLSGIEIKLI